MDINTRQQINNCEHQEKFIEELLIVFTLNAKNLPVRHHISVEITRHINYLKELEGQLYLYTNGRNRREKARQLQTKFNNLALSN